MKFLKTRVPRYKGSTQKKSAIVLRGIGWGLMLSHWMGSVDHWQELKGMLYNNDMYKSSKYQREYDC